MPCPCNVQVNQLLSQINAPSQNLGSPNLGNYLQNLGIFDLQNVFVRCLDLQIANNTISILNLNNPSGQQFSSNQIVSNAGVYVVVGNSQSLGCNTNIIYIGSSGNLNERIGEFIRELQRPQKQNPLHSGAKCIKEKLLASASQNTPQPACLYIFGFPIQTQISLQIAGRPLNGPLIGECIAKIAEACFLDTYEHCYKDLPCCVRRTPSISPIYNIFNSQQAQQDIQDLLENIDLTFKTCIQAC